MRKIRIDFSSDKVKYQSFNFAVLVNQKLGPVTYSQITLMRPQTLSPGPYLQSSDIQGACTNVRSDASSLFCSSLSSTNSIIFTVRKRLAWQTLGTTINEKTQMISFHHDKWKLSFNFYPQLYSSRTNFSGGMLEPLKRNK